MFVGSAGTRCDAACYSSRHLYARRVCRFGNRVQENVADSKLHAQPSCRALGKRLAHGSVEYSAHRTPRAVAVERGVTGPATVEELMNPDVITLTADMLIRDAVRVFLDQRISGAPVVGQDGKLLGILSEADIMWKEVGVPDDHWLIQPTFIGFADLVVAFRDDKKFKDELQKVLARTVGEAMTKDPVTVTPTVTAQEAASLMVHKKVARLPVLEEGKLVGMLTRSDIMRGMLLNNEL